jgi:hypothetical protein
MSVTNSTGHMGRPQPLISPQVLVSIPAWSPSGRFVPVWSATIPGGRGTALVAWAGKLAVDDTG